MKLMHLHCNWQQYGIGEFDDIFQSDPTSQRDGFYWTQNKTLKAIDLSFNLVFEYEKIKAQKAFILWSIPYLSIIPYEKMCIMIK